MSRRAMTVLEVLVSLCLLSCLAIACVVFVQTAAGRAAPLAESRRWELAARAVLQQIYDDLVVGDAARNEDAKKVWVENGNLCIRSRIVERGGAGAPEVYDTVVYRLNGSRGVLVRAATGAGEAEPAPLLGQLIGFSAIIEPAHDMVRVVLRSEAGPELTRGYSLR